jgi:prepilin-type N-terminal cleavage/methylation domain-containing protein
MQRPTTGFTLPEMLFAIAVLTLLISSMAILINNASTLIALSTKRSETAKQANRFLDRMAIDLNQMLRRADVDYYLKTPSNPQPGNDQIAFYSDVRGYYPSTGAQSPVSLVSYRVNTQKDLERLGKGLVWNGVSSSAAPPIVFLPRTLIATWPIVANGAPDPDYEIAGKNVFRFEYFYWLTSGEVSENPWDTSTGHDAVDGLRDVNGISIAVATIAPKSRVLLSDGQLTALANRMNDFALPMKPGDLAAQWRATLDAISDMPQSALAGIQIHQHHFDLTEKH